MRPRRVIFAALMLFLALAGTGCAPPSTPAPSVTVPATEAPSPAATLTAVPTATILPSPTPVPFYLSATVWQSEPRAPILLYHRFKTNRPSMLNIVSRADFKEELQKLHDSGYVTVSLERWLAGDLRVPEGKRPLVMSMDDLFYRNQITLLPDGTPSEESGLGMAWAFAQEHPDFGFHWALFASLGDKPYGEGTEEEKRLQLARAIVWCLEHDARVYNHTYRHAQLSQTDGAGVTSELRANDRELRNLLALVHREDLIPQLGNLFAIPYGKWPRSDDGLTALYGYRNPEGLSLQAIFDVDYIIRPKFMAPPYSEKFDRWFLPRMVANLAAVDYLVQNKDDLPAAGACQIGPLEQSRRNDAAYLGDQILAMIRSGTCAAGVYATEAFVFRADASRVEPIQAVKQSP